MEVAHLGLAHLVERSGHKRRRASNGRTLFPLCHPTRRDRGRERSGGDGEGEPRGGLQRKPVQGDAPVPDPSSIGTASTFV